MDSVKISAFTVYGYVLPLVRPITFRDRQVRERTGLLVRMVSESGQIGWGEAAPVPGFSRETTETAQTELVDGLHSLKRNDLPDEIERLDGTLAGCLDGFDLSASIRFALETALLQVRAAELNLSIARLINPNAVNTLRVNGFVTGTPEEVIERSRKLQRDGYRAIKVKVGRQSLEDDINTVKHVFHELDSRCRLRLDTNRSWELDDAIRFAEAVADVDLEYVEEPVKTTEQLRELLNRMRGVPQRSFPLALDESLCESAAVDVRQWSGVAALVLKPTLLGGIERTAALARDAKLMGIKAVLSSSFESSLGIAVLGQLAAACGTTGLPIGLDTVDWFVSDVLADPIGLSGGKMLTSQLARAAQTVDESRLQEVARG